MNIDKFGHHIHKRMRLTDLFDFPQKALLKEENEEFDLHKTRLKGVKTPVEADDAVNKRYVDERIRNLCTKQDLQILMETYKKEINVHLEKVKASVSYYLNQFENISKTVKSSNNTKE